MPVMTGSLIRAPSIAVCIFVNVIRLINLLWASSNIYNEME